MNLYSIGQAIDSFKSPTSVAYAVRGAMKGAMIYIDMDNNGVLTTIYPDGEVFTDFMIRYAPDTPEEDRKSWVMLEELAGDTSDLAMEVFAGVLGLQQRLMANFLKGMAELTEEEQNIVVDELTKYAENFLVDKNKK